MSHTKRLAVIIEFTAPTTDATLSLMRTVTKLQKRDRLRLEGYGHFIQPDAIAVQWQFSLPVAREAVAILFSREIAEKANVLGINVIITVQPLKE